MWTKPKDRLFLLCYEIENYQMIKIFDNRDRGMISHDSKENYDYYAYVLDPFKLKSYRVSDDNLDILKLKCLITAKTVGWQIKKVTI
jgi:hypothetical protein